MKRLVCNLLVVLAGMLVLPLMASATTYVVRPDGTGDYATIQAAVTAVANGSVIELTDGTFIGAGNRDIDYAGKQVTIRSQGGNAEACVIDCQGSSGTPHIGVYFDSAEGANSKLERVKIINGFDSMGSKRAINVWSASPVIDGNIFVDNGIYIYGNANPMIVRNVFRDFNTGGGMVQPPISVSNTSSYAATVTIEDNAFINSTFGGEFSSGKAISVSGTGSATNTAYIRRNVFENLTGNAVSLGGTGDVTVWGYLDDNVIKACGNTTMSTPAVNISTNSTSDTHALMSGNLIYDCPAAAISISGVTTNIWVEVDGSTIANCGIGIKKGSAVTSLIVDHSILWNTDDLNGAIVAAEVTCNDISDGDFSGVNSNFSQDPLFCDPLAGDYHIAAESPCINAVGCGLVGALGADCGFMINVVADIGYDQGRSVRVNFGATVYDVIGSQTPIVRYDVFRKIKSLPHLVMGTHQIEMSPVANPDGIALAGWDFAGSVPAYCEDEYNAIVPTLADSNAAGLYWTTFFVRAATASPGVYFDTAPDSGYSVDNLPPSVPGGFTVAYQAGVGNTLIWDEALDADFQYWRVHSGTTPDFVPGPGNLVHETIENQWSDPGSGVRYYKIVAVDFNGNPSDPASADNTTDAVEGSVAFSLRVQSPATNGLTVHFALPTSASARLELYDVAGRRVVRHDVSGIGSHVVNLARGKNLSSGVYFVRLTQDDARRDSRVTFIR